jgi:hypothetical protein
MTKFLLSLALTGLAWSATAIACDDGVALADQAGSASVASQAQPAVQKSTRPTAAQKTTKGATTAAHAAKPGQDPSPTKLACSGPNC